MLRLIRTPLAPWPGIAALGLVMMIVGCKPQISDKDIVKLDVAQAREYLVRPPTTSIFESPKPGIWVDPRRKPDYVLGHIPGAVNIPFATVSMQWEYLRGYGPKIVYGETYNDPLADAMSKTLMEYGLSDIYTLRGGIEAWIEADMELEKGAPPPLENQRPPRKRRIRH
ncbi:MAG: rhodanese-like domain-containing protein [Phycisphaerales bacterium]|nr:rhodanese-like domain-containing protein [Phycisphaerales bacterium]